MLPHCLVNIKTEMTVMTIKTKGGANIYYLQTDKFKTTTVSVNIFRPLENEAAANALLTRILKAASAKYDSKTEIEKRLEWMYGAVFSADVNKKGEMQILNFEITAPSDVYTGEDTASASAEFLKEIIYNPKIKDGMFDKGIFAIEKENLKNLIFASENDKREFATQRCIEEMCTGEAFAIPRLGTVTQLERITNAQLYEHYENVIKNSRVDIFVSGTCNIESIKNIFDDTVSCDIITKPLNLSERNGVKEVHEIMDVNQGKLVMGMTVNAPFYDTVVFNSVYGSGTHSKLFNNVREKLSLAYYAYSRYIRAKSVIIVGTGIEFDKYELTKDEVFNQLKEMQNGNISDFEIESAKKFIETIYVSMKDDPKRMIDFYVSQNIAGDSDGLDEFIDGIKKVTRDDIISAAKSVKANTIYFLKGTN